MAEQRLIVTPPPRTTSYASPEQTVEIITRPDGSKYVITTAKAIHTQDEQIIPVTTLANKSASISTPPATKTIVNSEGKATIVPIVQTTAIPSVPMTREEIVASEYLTPHAKEVLLKGITEGKIIAPITVPMTKTQIEKSKYLTPHAKEVLKSGIEEGMIVPTIKTPKGTAQAMWWGTTPWKEEEAESLGSYGVVKGIGVMSAEIVVPGVYTARHWSGMSTGEKILGIGLDALSIIPVAGAAGRGAREVSVLGRAGKAARIAGAAKGAGREITRQILFPLELAKTVTSIGKPVEIIGKAGKVEKITGVRAASQNTKNIIQATAGKIKGSLSSIETLVSPRKLPESVVTDTYHTIKIPMSKFENTTQMIKARTSMLKAASKPGNKVVINTSDNIIEIKRSPLMRELGGGVSHATPHGEAYATGMIVEWKQNMPLREQGLFLSPEPLERFAGSTSRGIRGEKPAIIIMSPEMASKAKVSKKLYKGTVEMEATYPVGFELPKPKQILYTRMGDTGQKIELYLHKPLTKTQILKLKAEGLVEQFKNIYQPSITVTSKADGMTSSEINALADVIDKSEEGLARNLRIIAPEPEGLARVLTEIHNPTVYRTTDITRSDGSLQTIVTRTERMPNESNREYIARVEDEVARGEIDRIAIDERITTKPTAIITKTYDGEKHKARIIRIAPDVKPAFTKRPERDTRVIDSNRKTIVVRREDGKEPTTPRPPVIEDTNRFKVNKNTVEGRKNIANIRLRLPAKLQHLTDEQLDQAVTWRQGELHGKDVYIVAYPPFQDNDKVYIMGNAPFGIREVNGAGSAVATAEIIGGVLHKSININVGAFQARIPSGTKGKVGKRLTFVKRVKRKISPWKKVSTS